jgi:hypothetical protein
MAEMIQVHPQLWEQMKEAMEALALIEAGLCDDRIRSSEGAMNRGRCVVEEARRLAERAKGGA